MRDKVFPRHGKVRGASLKQERRDEMPTTLGLLALAMEGLKEIRSGRGLSHQEETRLLDARYGPSKRGRN